LRTLPYASWPSSVGADLVTAGQRGLSFPWIDGGRIFWQESRPSERGRQTLMCRAPDGTIDEVTPAPFDLRTRVHEYGGRAFMVGGDVIVAIDDRDQRVWRLDGAPPDGGPLALTPECGGAMRFADMIVDTRRDRLIAVRESAQDGGDPVADLVAIPLDGSCSLRPLAADHDFFAHPSLDPVGERLAWITWDHPDMPWDATSLWCAALDDEGAVVSVEPVAGGRGEAVLQPQWGPEGELFHLSDRDGYWNVHGSRRGIVDPRAADHGGPLWQLGARWFDVDATGAVHALVVEEGFWSLERLGTAPDGQGRRRIGLAHAVLSDLVVENGIAVICAAAVDGAAAIVRVDLASGTHEAVARAFDVPLAPEAIARPQPFDFATADGAVAHAFYYPPTHPDVRGTPGTHPPLIVRCHGGPTGSASPALSLRYQYWTSRGFALCDVNYRGSSGYGRAYRRALDGRWGEADVADCIAAAEHLVAQGRADPERLVIAGGSAGGYTVLCALTFSDRFRAGASSYGIGDLATLAQDTHKFEKRYLDRLVGPWPEARATYEARSPILHTDRLSCPVIFFQGLEDKVVPPAQAEAMVEALDAKGIPVCYMPFAGEGHGFRRAETQKAVLEAEYAFYCRIFGIEPAEPLPPITIRNLEPRR